MQELLRFNKSKNAVSQTLGHWGMDVCFFFLAADKKTHTLQYDNHFGTQHTLSTRSGKVVQRWQLCKVGESCSRLLCVSPVCLQLELLVFMFGCFLFCFVFLHHMHTSMRKKTVLPARKNTKSNNPII